MTAFAMATETVDGLCFNLPPCAQQLYRWLLRRFPGGIEQEIDLNDFNEFAARGRKKPYCDKWIRSALRQLTEVGLVAIAHKFNAREFKLTALHPRQLENKSSRTENKSSSFEYKTSEKAASNPHGSVPLYRDLHTATEPTAAVEKTVGEDVGGRPRFETDGGQAEQVSGDPKAETFKGPVGNECDSSESAKIPPAVAAKLDRAEDLGVEINSAVEGVAMRYQQNIDGALALLYRKRRDGTAKNSTALFVAALQGGWRDTETEERDRSRELERQVYDRVAQWREAGHLVSVSIERGRLVVRVNGEIVPGETFLDMQM